MPLDTGHRKRSYNLMKLLRENGRVTSLGYLENDKYANTLEGGGIVDREITLAREPEQRSGLAFNLSLLAQLGGTLPYFVKKNTSQWLSEQQRKLCRDDQTDLILCDCLDVAAAIDFTLPVPKILLTNGIATELWQQRYDSSHGVLRRAYFNYETKRMASFESAICNKFDMILVASDRDRESLQNDYRVRVPVEVVPTGVDCSYFAPQPEVEMIPRRLVFTGSNDMLSNIDGLLWFAAEIYPAIKRVYPEVSFDIVGARPASEIIALGRKDDSIRVTGWVEDVRPYLAAAELFVVPLRVPGGTRVKVFEAMSMRKPVISTFHGTEGLGLIDGLQLATVANAREMAAGIIDLLADSEKSARLAEGGCRLVRAEHDWSVVARKMANCLKEAIA